MKLTILADNNTYIDCYLFGEPGLSFYIEDGDERILFDTGYSDVFMRNAELIGIDLSKTTKIVISHGHVDHTGGLVPFIEKYGDRGIALYGHTKVFTKKINDGKETGSPIRKEEVAKYFDLKLCDGPAKITDDLVFLGQIPETFDFEARVPIGERVIGGITAADYNIDDSAMAFIAKEGLFIITGCSHAGICNIIEYAKRITGIDKVIGVIGGFHLFEDDSRLASTVDYFIKNDVAYLHPCHCVSLYARAAILRRMPITETGAGMSISVE